MKPLQSLFLGILAAMAALFLEIAALIFFDPLPSPSKQTFYGETASLNFIFFINIFIEEFLKYFIIYKTLNKISAGKNLVFNSLLMGIGFSALEIAFIYWKYQDGMTENLLGILGIIIIHISTSIIMGYAVSKKPENALASFALGFMPAFAIHFFYNFGNLPETIFQNKFILPFLGFLLVIDFLLLITSRLSKSTASV